MVICMEKKMVILLRKTRDVDIYTSKKTGMGDGRYQNRAKMGTLHKVMCTIANS